MDFIKLIFDKVLISIVGIFSALFTDYFIQKRREKKNNKWKGLNKLKKQIINKYTNEFRNNIFMELENEETENYLKKKDLHNQISEFFKTCFDNQLMAKNQGEELIKKLN